MKILLINVVYDKGSTGSIVKSLYNEYKLKGFDPYIVYGRGKKNSNDTKIRRLTFEIESKIHHFFSKFFGNIYGGMFFSTLRIISYIKKLKPDYINLHCLNGYFVNIYKLLKFLAKNKYKVLMTMHADFMMTGGCGYSVDCDNYLIQSCKMCPNFRKFNSSVSINAAHINYKRMNQAIKMFEKTNLRISCVSPWLTNRYRLSPMYRNYQVDTILNPVDDIFLGDDFSTLKNERFVLYVTPNFYDEEKNGRGIEILIKNMPDVDFVIISTRRIVNFPSYKNVTIISGGINKKELCKYYSTAACLILLSKRETFSMPVAESLSCGTPVVGFKNGGSESFSSNLNTKWHDYNDYDGLERSIRSYISCNQKIRTQAFSKENICKNYLDLFNNF